MAKASQKSTLFGSGSLEPANDDKLQNLYWNRAQLKQQFAEKADENYRLEKLLKEQEGVTARVRQRLEHIENLLYDPDWVFNAAVFYQLRGLNKRCCAKLARFAEQLKQQREQRVHEDVLKQWNAEQQAQAAGIQKRVAERRVAVQLLEDQLAGEHERISAMNGISKMLKGRQASAAVEELEAELASARGEEQELLAELESIQQRARPEVPGLDTAQKRSINFMILSFAQELLFRFSDRNFAAMVKEASEKSVGAINYGSKDDCDRLFKRISEQAEALDKPLGNADALKDRAARIAEHADFPTADAAVPTPGTVATLFMFDAAGAVRTADGNILGEDYWSLSEVLSR